MGLPQTSEQDECVRYKGWEFQAICLIAGKRHFEGNGVANGIRTRNNKLHKLGLYH
jgi:hypothetical protein